MPTDPSLAKLSPSFSTQATLNRHAQRLDTDVLSLF